MVVSPFERVEAAAGMVDIRTHLGHSPQALSGGQKRRDIGKDSISERAEKIGIVMQNPNHMISKPMIFDEVALGLAARGWSKEQINQRVENTLKICGLYPFRNWPISALSYGQKKRVTIASILVLNLG